MANLLIVDDEPTTLKGLSETIAWQKIGIQAVYTAENGREAVRILEKKPISILLTDIRMPIMDGLKLIDYVFEHRPSIRMIVLSGYHDFTYAQHAIKRNVVDYLLKPVNVDELMQVAGRIALKQQQELSQEFVIPESSHHQIKQALSYLYEHMHEPVSVNHTAGAIGLSPNYFSALFKQKTGCSFTSFLNQLRIKSAQKLLLETEYTIVDIAERVGYNDYKYFSRKFKEIVGCTPNHYRNN